MDGEPLKEANWEKLYRIFWVMKNETLIKINLSSAFLAANTIRVKYLDNSNLNSIHLKDLREALFSGILKR